MNKRFLLAASILIVVVLISIMLAASLSNPVEGKKLRVATSIYPLGDIASQVGGDKVEVINITPVGVEPHEYEPSPQDIVTLQEAQVFVYSGAGLEGWVAKVLPDLKGVALINASAGLPLRQQESVQGTPVVDPHYYLDPVLAQRVAQTVADKLIEVDPENRLAYEKALSPYLVKLADLDQEYKESLARCAGKEFVTAHDAFGYLAQRYGLTQLPIAGLAEEEPSPQALAQIVQHMRDNGIRYVFKETLGSSRLAETVAGEVGAQVLVLNPIEGQTPDDKKKGTDYLGFMNINLQNLRQALDCS